MKEQSNPDLKIVLEEDTVLSAITKDGEYIVAQQKYLFLFWLALFLLSTPFQVHSN